MQHLRNLPYSTKVSLVYDFLANAPAWDYGNDCHTCDSGPPKSSIRKLLSLVPNVEDLASSKGTNIFERIVSPPTDREEGAMPSKSELNNLLIRTKFIPGTIPRISSLIALGADINAQTGAGNTVMHKWAPNMDWEAVEFGAKLLEWGGRVDILNNMGESPLHIAIEYHRYRCATVLLSHPLVKCIINTKNKDGCTPWHLALSNYMFITELQSTQNSMYSELRDGLLSAGADPTIEVSSPSARESILDTLSKFGLFPDQVKPFIDNKLYEEHCQNIRGANNDECRQEDDSSLRD
ncbi:hypothetical protein ABW19_dt0210503 [Dactylella cylindrospora]|nr:hypothetical protein ABW19_dt0210503 [Dactylella cylindrospora]